jgi:hypothetical protein
MPKIEKGKCRLRFHCMGKQGVGISWAYVFVPVYRYDIWRVGQEKGQT